MLFLSCFVAAALDLINHCFAVIPFCFQLVKIWGYFTCILYLASVLLSGIGSYCSIS